MYFMTKDTAEFSQFHAAARREYTLPRDEEALQPKGWIRGNIRIGPVLEVTICCLHGKYRVEIRIMSINKDNAHSWVRISHGSNKLVTNLNNNEQETSEVQLEEFSLKLNASDFACRSKAKAKPQRLDSASSSTRTFFIGERTWTDVEPGEYSLSDYAVSKKLIIFSVMEIKYIEKMMERFKSGESKTIFRNISCIALIGLIAKGKYAWQEEEETRKYSSTVLMLQEQLCISELLKDIQDAILLILHYRTMSLFRTTSSSAFIMSDVQSIYIPSSILDWYLEVKI